MKYFECIVDNQDGSFTTHRFKSKEDALAWACDQGDWEEWDCYPYSGLDEVDTDSKYFWSWPCPWSNT
jgi:hypothetical protein